MSVVAFQTIVSYGHGHGACDTSHISAMAMDVAVFVLRVTPSAVFHTQANPSVIAFLPNLWHSDDFTGHADLPQAWSLPHLYHIFAFEH